MRSRALFRLASFVSMAMVAASCLSPTLPLPPPDHPDNIEPGMATGTWNIGGQCIAGALVTVFNTATAHGVVVEDINNTGSYHVTIGGNACDVVWVAQQTSDGESSEAGFVLQGYTNGNPDDPAACH
jgi:hypothetical protein